MTSSKLPPRFRSKDIRRGVSQAPRSKQDVEVSVVVVIGVAAVEREDLIGEPGLLRDILEGAVASVAEQDRAALRVGGRHEDVEPAVAVEVVYHAATGHCLAPGIEPNAGRDVPHPTRVILRALESAQRQQGLRRDTFRILADRHVGDVQEPLDSQVLGPRLEISGEVPDGLARAGGPLVDGGGAEREDAARLVAAGHAVLDLAATERGDAPQRVHVGERPGRSPWVGGLRPGRMALAWSQRPSLMYSEPISRWMLADVEGVVGSPGGSAASFSSRYAIPRSARPTTESPI